MKFSIGLIALVCSAAQAAANTSVPSLKCPPKEAKCNYNYKSFTPIDSGAPTCWSESYGNWGCSSKVYGKCPKGKTDITKCNYKPVRPQCPKVGTGCINEGDIYYIFGRVNVPECWKSKGTGFECNPKVNGTCAESDITLDVSTCPGYVEPKPVCPKPDDTCVSNLRTFVAYDPETPNCWSKNEKGWKCENPDSGKSCDAIKQVDIKSCNVTVTKPDCPPLGSYCDYNGSKLALSYSRVPPCWKRDSYKGWICKLPELTGFCKAVDVNINRCPRFEKP